MKQATHFRVFLGPRFPASYKLRRFPYHKFFINWQRNCRFSRKRFGTRNSFGKVENMDSDKQDEELSRGTFNCFCAYERPVIKSLNKAKSPFTVAFEALSKYPIHQACTNQECIYYSPYDFSRVPPEPFSTCVCIHASRNQEMWRRESEKIEID